MSSSEQMSPMRRKRKPDTVRAKLRCQSCGLLCQSEFGFLRHQQQSACGRQSDNAFERVDVAKLHNSELQSKSAEAAYAMQVQMHLLEAYSALRYDKFVDANTVQQGVKEGLVQPLVLMMKDEIKRRLCDTPAEEARIEKIIKTVFDVHNGIESAAKEFSLLKSVVAPLAPRRRDLVDAPDKNGHPTGRRRGDHVYDVPVCEEIRKMFRESPDLLQHCREAALRWSRAGAAMPDEYKDVCDGRIFREHPMLGRKSPDGDSTKLAFMLYFDELEVVNPLGAFHGRHQLGLFYWALVNIEPESRMAFHNLHLATVALKQDIEYYGINQIVSGLPGDTSFGSSMMELDHGIEVNGLSVRGWTVCLCADFPAAGLCAGVQNAPSGTV